MEKSSAASFDDIMDLLERGSELADSFGPAHPASGIASQPQSEPAYVSSSTVSQIYESSAETYGLSIDPPVHQQRPASQARAVPRIFLPPTKPEQIARELRLRPYHTVEDLVDIRRKFALRNHPDRAADEVRDAATLRMSIANRLIDDAIRARTLAKSA